MNSLCNNCGAHADLQCARCHNACYCDRKCQKAAWRTHKLKCVPQRIAEVRRPARGLLTLEEASPDEIANIRHKFACWKLIRGEGWAPNYEKYPRSDPAYPHPGMLYKVLTVVDPRGLFGERIVSEAKEFCDYWISTGIEF